MLSFLDVYFNHLGLMYSMILFLILGHTEITHLYTFEFLNYQFKFSLLVDLFIQILNLPYIPYSVVENS